MFSLPGRHLNKRWKKWRDCNEEIKKKHSGQVCCCDHICHNSLRFGVNILTVSPPMQHVVTLSEKWSSRRKNDGVDGEELVQMLRCFNHLIPNATFFLNFLRNSCSRFPLQSKMNKGTIGCTRFFQGSSKVVFIFPLKLCIDPKTTVQIFLRCRFFYSLFLRKELSACAHELPGTSITDIHRKWNNMTKDVFYISSKRLPEGEISRGQVGGRVRAGWVWISPRKTPREDQWRKSDSK